MKKATKITEWQTEINGNYYNISHEIIKRKHMLTINESTQEVRCGFTSAVIGFDEKFMLDGMEARLVFEKNKPDIVVNGIFLRSGKTYIQRPTWAVVFPLICALIPIVSLGGSIPFLLAFVGATLCIYVAKTSLPPAARIILCVVITLLVWFLWFILFFRLVIMQFLQ